MKMLIRSTFALIVWVGILILAGIIREVDTSFFTSIITLIVIVINNPWVIGFLYVYLIPEEEKSKLSIMNGALGGVFATLITSSIPLFFVIRLFGHDFPEDLPRIGDLWGVDFILTIIQGGIAGIIPILLISNKEKKLETSPEISNETNQTELFFSRSYLVIPLAYLALAGLLLIAYGINGFATSSIIFFLLLLGPSMQVAIAITLLRKLHNNALSAFAALASSLVFLVAAIAIFGFATQLIGPASMLAYAAPVVLSGIHIATLVVILLTGWVVKYFKKTSRNQA